MDFDWEELEKQIKDIRMGERIQADTGVKFGALINDYTKEKFPEWREKLGPIVRNIIESNKHDPEAAAEVLILIMLQMVHQLAQHEVLFEYAEKFNAKIVQQIKTLDERTTTLFDILGKNRNGSKEEST